MSFIKVFDYDLSVRNQLAKHFTLESFTRINAL
jgi:hypothetical protein